MVLRQIVVSVGALFVANPGPQTSGAGGGLADLLKGGLGGLLAGGAAGGVLSGGLNDLLVQFQQNGQGDVAKSWIGSRPNKAISPDDLANALGADRINDLMSYSGMSREDLLNGLSRQLPNAVDKLTPDDVCRPNSCPHGLSHETVRGQRPCKWVGIC